MNTHSGDITFAFPNKVVLIAGASGSIGIEITKIFAKAGAKLGLLSNSHQGTLVDLVSSLSLSPEQYKVVAADLTNQKKTQLAVEKILQRFGHIDYLVNCVGVYIDGDEWNMDENAWKKTIDVNLLSAMHLSKFIGQHFIKRQTGVMVHVASRFAIVGNYAELAYSASKAGLVSLVQSYARLLAPFGRANAVSPSAVYGGYWLRASQEEIEEMKRQNPMHQFLEAKDVATLCAYLCTDEAKMITCQNISIDGGFKLR